MRASRGDRLTRAIVSLCVVVWLIVLLTGSERITTIEGGFIPGRFDPRLAEDFVIPAILTPISSAFLHGGAMHLGFNMLMLYYCGRQVEPMLGPARLGLLYLVGAYVAAAAQYALDPQSLSPMIGASGAISAVLGAFAIYFSSSEAKAFGPIPAYWVRAAWIAAGWVGIQVLIGLAGFSSGGMAIAIGAHIGGFIAGVLMARPLLKSAYRTS